jgi:hypothetical protein
MKKSTDCNKSLARELLEGGGQESSKGKSFTWESREMSSIGFNERQARSEQVKNHSRSREVTVIIKVSIALESESEKFAELLFKFAFNRRFDEGTTCYAGLALIPTLMAQFCEKKLSEWHLSLNLMSITRSCEDDWQRKPASFNMKSFAILIDSSSNGHELRFTDWQTVKLSRNLCFAF